MEEKIEAWFDKYAHPINEDRFTMQLYGKLPFSIEDLISWLIENKGTGFILEFAGDDYRILFELDSTGLSISINNKEFGFHGEVRGLGGWLGARRYENHSLGEFLEKVLGDVGKHDERIFKNLEIFNINIEELRKENAIFENYHINWETLDFIKPYYEAEESVNLEIKLVNNNINTLIISGIDLLKHRKKYKNILRKKLNQALVFHTFAVVVEDIEFSYNITQARIDLYFRLTATVLLNEEYYRTIGYYLSQINMICQNKQYYKLDNIASEIGYKGDITCESLLDYIYLLKSSDFTESTTT